jgi:hypothetical protein
MVGSDLLPPLLEKGLTKGSVGELKKHLLDMCLKTYSNTKESAGNVVF